MKTRSNGRLLAALGCGLTCAAFVWAGAAGATDSLDLITVQARVMKNAVPADADLDLTFEIHNTSSGGTALFTEAQSGVPVRNGILSVSLGAGTALGSTFKNLASSSDRYVAIKLTATGEEICPRVRLTAVPYAQAAEVASYLWDPGTHSFRTLTDLVGSGLTNTGGTITVAVGSGLEINSGSVRLAADADSNNGLVGGGASALTVNVGAGIQLVSDVVKAKPADFLNGKLAEIDADGLRIDLTPTNYTPSTSTSPASIVSNTTDLTAHLKGIDNALANVTGTILPSVVDGRLSASSAAAVSTTDQLSDTLYYLPYTGTKISLYDGTAWSYVDFGSGASASITTLTTTTTPVHDVFLYKSGGSIAFEFAKWTSDTARTALGTRDGVYVKANDNSRRYVGTIYVVNSSGIKVQDAVRQRFVWNADNRVEYVDTSYDSNSSWTLSNTVNYRGVDNGTAAWNHQWVVGLAEGGHWIYAQLYYNATGASLNAWLGFGYDTSSSIDASSAAAGCGQYFMPASVTARTAQNTWARPDELGFHQVWALERSSGTGSITLQGGVQAKMITRGQR